jgi:hypothetical protein
MGRGRTRSARVGEAHAPCDQFPFNITGSRVTSGPREDIGINSGDADVFSEYRRSFQSGRARALPAVDCTRLDAIMAQMERRDIDQDRE